MKGKGNFKGQGGKTCRSAREQIRTLWWNQTGGHFLWHVRCIYDFLKSHVSQMCVSYQCESYRLTTLATWYNINQIARRHSMGWMDPIISIWDQSRIGFFNLHDSFETLCHYLSYQLQVWFLQDQLRIQPFKAFWMLWPISLVLYPSRFYTNQAGLHWDDFVLLQQLWDIILTCTM